MPVCNIPEERCTARCALRGLRACSEPNLGVFALDKRNRPLMPFAAEKGARPVEELLAGERAVLARLKAPDATPGALYAAVADTGLPVEACSGSRTTYSHARLGHANTHALEASVGEVAALIGRQIPSTEIKASGTGDYCRTKPPYALPRGCCVCTTSVRVFKTGDRVRAEVPNDKQADINVTANRGSCQRLLHSGQGRRNQRQERQTFPSRGPLWAWLAARASPPAEGGGLQRGKLG
jgi:hypothetical protein